MGISKFVKPMPDVFVVIDIEGKGRFLPTFIEREYQGQQMLISFQAPKAGFGDKITVNFYRDKSVSNHIWNRILQTPMDVKYRPANGISAAFHIQLANEDLSLTPPELLNQAVLVNPYHMSYKFYDEKTKITHGEVKLSIK